MNTPAVSLEPPPGLPRIQALGLGVWVMIGVGCALFGLFLAAYVMRMDGGDWAPIALPWQLWLSTAVLVAASLALHRAARAGERGLAVESRRALWAGGALAFAFLAVQAWAWMALQSAQVVAVGNPAASFFFLLTALHALHVMGGLLAWGVALRAQARDADVRATAWRVRLCARYWHFLLAVWVVLFAALGVLTPELVAYLCGTA
jgi:cytochrome c oxidase subunit III